MAEPAKNPDEFPSSIDCINPLARPDWDDRIRGFENASVFHSSHWCRTLTETYGFTPLYLTLIRGGNMIAVMPLMEARSLLTGRRGVSLPFTDECPALFNNRDDARLLWDKAIEMGRLRRWNYLEVRDAGFLDESSPPSCIFHGHSLRLTRDTAALTASYDSTVRRALRKTPPPDLAIEISSSAKAIEEYYELHCLTRQHHGVPPQSLAWFRSIHAQAFATGHGCVVLAKLGGRPIAGAVYLNDNRSAVYKYGASDRHFLHLHPNHRVMDAAIRHYAERGFTRFDFGRTSVLNTGLADFKRRWGTTERPIAYHRFDIGGNRFLLTPDKASGPHTRLFRHVPVSLAKIIGLLIYRHMT